MDPAAYELAQYLADQGVGEYAGNGAFSIHVSREPVSPSDVVTLYDTGGTDPLIVDGADIGQPGIQVRVRCTDYLAGFQVQREIRDLLVQPDGVEDSVPLEREIEGTRYIGINQLGDIIAIGRDDNDRHILVANYRVIRQPLEGS